MPGFDAHFVSDLQKRHECPICELALRQPLQTECGHLFCKDCLEPILKSRRPLCPVDQEPISKEGVRELPYHYLIIFCVCTRHFQIMHVGEKYSIYQFIVSIISLVVTGWVNSLN